MSTYKELKESLLLKGRQFEDPDFPARADSIHADFNVPEDWLWKRPRDIVVNPKFVVDGASRFDLIQGDLGDCWFISAAAVLATRPEHFKNVVDASQDFLHDYAGIFHFRFWRYGEWVEVVVDDLLPVDVDGKLRFAHNRQQPNEFWPALLEKAYAKVMGSYRSLEGGHVREALVDFTGGLSESYRLRDEDDLPPDLFNIVLTAFNMGALFGAYIMGDAEELIEYTGLYRGHAYSITQIIERRIQGWSVKLLRLRNPWGRGEWSGAWSDGSDEWKSVPEADRKEMGLVMEEDGEFWMSFEDLLKNFSILEIVHLGPASFTQTKTKPVEGAPRWHEAAHHGRWVKGVNAGGCGLFSATEREYYSNPRFVFRLTEPDPGDVAGECTCVVALMQKDYRKRKVANKKIIVGFDVHQLKVTPREIKELVGNKYLDKSKLKKKFFSKSPLRENTCRVSLDPGVYCVVCGTLRVNQEAEFLLRIFTYSNCDTKEDLPHTGPLPSPTAVQPAKPVGNLSSEVFYEFAGEDLVVDARDLRDLLNQLSRKELGETVSFGIESCRLLISIIDKKDRTGTLDFEQMAQLWDEILYWRKVFERHDKDKSGCIETYELQTIFAELGFSLSFETLTTIAIRYGGKERSLFFEDFCLCVAKTLLMYDVFKDRSRGDKSGKAAFTLEEWMQTTLYH